MRKYFFILLTVCFILSSCSKADENLNQVKNDNTKTSESESIVVVDAKDETEISNIVGYGTPLIIEDIVAISAVGYYIEDRVEESTTYLGVYITVENLSSQPIDKMLFGARRSNYTGLMPAPYLETSDEIIALNGRFYKGDYPFNDIDTPNTEFIQVGATAKAFVGYELDASAITALSDDIENCNIMFCVGDIVGRICLSDVPIVDIP